MTTRRQLVPALVMEWFAAPSRVPQLPATTRRPDRGMVLMETAIAIPVLAAVAIALAWGVSLGATTMALGDAARQVARDVARGVTVPEAVAAAQDVAPGAMIHVAEEGSSVVIIADREVAAPVPILSGISVTLSQRVAIPREWT